MVHAHAHAWNMHLQLVDVEHEVGGALARESHVGRRAGEGAARYIVH